MASNVIHLMSLSSSRKLTTSFVRNYYLWLRMLNWNYPWTAQILSFRSISILRTPAGGNSGIPILTMKKHNGRNLGRLLHTTRRRLCGMVMLLNGIKIKEKNRKRMQLLRGKVNTCRTEVLITTFKKRKKRRCSQRKASPKIMSV